MAAALVGSLARSFVLGSLLCGFVLTASVRAEVLVRWDRDQAPSPDSLGVSTLVIPAKNKAAAQRALEQGYSVVLEVDAPALATFTPPAGRVTGVIVKGTATRAQLSQLRLRLKPRGITARTLEERGKWPHIRSNWVTNENGVLQVSSRTQQPWIENNAALIKIAQVTQPDAVPLLTYPWTPITLSDVQEGPALENYLVAIAESGSFGADLVLPLHERFQNDLLLGLPRARAWWTDIRRTIAFYSSNLPNRYQAAATIGVVTADPMRWFEVMNLLSRHTLPFELIPQDKFVEGRHLSKLDLLVVLDAPDARQVAILMSFAEKGGKVVLPGIQGKFPWQSTTPAAKTETQATYAVGKGRIVEHRDPPANPDTFAQQVRQLLGRDNRVLQMWNGITVIAARYESPAAPAAPAASNGAAAASASAGGDTVLLTALNYAHQELPLQVRVPGKFSAVHLESPEADMTLLPYQQRDGFTEFVIPALRVGARVFLTPDAAAASSR
jgi:hypothetical protein